MAFGTARVTRALGDIQMLRHLDGEKHLIWASGASLGKDDAAALAGIASHARVAVYSLQVYGLSSIPGNRDAHRLPAERPGGDNGGKSFPTSWPKDVWPRLTP